MAGSLEGAAAAGSAAAAGVAQARAGSVREVAAAEAEHGHSLPIPGKFSDWGTLSRRE